MGAHATIIFELEDQSQNRILTSHYFDLVPNRNLVLAIGMVDCILSPGLSKMPHALVQSQIAKTNHNAGWRRNVRTKTRKHSGILH